jgi:4-amino-4-deoxy-L-arabinose transferase-like glycosyltransferase
MTVLEKRGFYLGITTSVLLFSSALLVRLAVVWLWRFDGLYGQDAFAYYQQALAITNFAPEDFFWPNGYPLLAELWMGLLGRHEVAAQFATLFCGAALAPLVYGMGRELFPNNGHRIGLWAGLIVTVAGQAILSSVVIMADMPALFWAVLASWLLVRAWSGTMEVTSGIKRHQGYLLAAGVALGLAVVTRWAYGLLALPFAAYTLFQSRKYKRPFWLLLLPAVGGLVVLLPQIWLSLNRPESLLHTWLLSWRLSNAFGRHFEHIDGVYNYLLPVGIYYLYPLFHPNYMLPVLGLAALWGGWTLWQKRAWEALLLLGGWAGIVYLFLSGIPYENFRFGLTHYLPLVILAGVGVEALRSEPPTRIAHRGWERGVILVVAASLVVMALWAVRSANNFLTAQNASKETARAIAELLPVDATILAFGLTLTLEHYTDLKVVELYNLDEEGLEVATLGASPLYLLLDTENLAQQWQDRPPQINYRWLQEERRLTPVRDFPPYTLFQVTTADDALP